MVAINWKEYIIATLPYFVNEQVLLHPACSECLQYSDSGPEAQKRFVQFKHEYYKIKTKAHKSDSY